MLIYSDESGDLGWSFDSPYRNGGSSRYLTIASYMVDESIKHIPKRLTSKLYTKFNWLTSVEKKWSDMSPEARKFFSKGALQIIVEHKELIRYLSITVKKENAADHIRKDSNKLYNYMLGMSLLGPMSKYETAYLFPDARAIKVGSGNSLHDYLQTKLWFDKGSKTELQTQPCDSSGNRSIQFVDMLAGLVQNHFEDGSSESWGILKSSISYKTLFFEISLYFKLSHYLNLWCLYIFRRYSPPTA